MIVEMSLIVAGIPLGYAVSKQKKTVQATSKLLTVVIYALLFLIGLNLGSNDELVVRIGELGLQGFIVGILAALGSVFVICFLLRKFLSPKTDS